MIESRPISEAYHPDMKYATSREDWRKKYGSEPPPYVPGQPYRKWSLPASVLTEMQKNGQLLSILQESESGVVGELTKLFPTYSFTAPNFPDDPEPQLRVKPIPTKTAYVDSFGQETPLNPTYLLEEYQAAALTSEIAKQLEGAWKYEEQGYYGPFRIIYRDTRRVYVLKNEDSAHSLGLLWYNQRYASGEEATGKWKKHGKELLFSADPHPQQTPPEDLDYVPVPLRELAPNEKVRRTPFGWVLDVQTEPAPSVDTIEVRMARLEWRVEKLLKAVLQLQETTIKLQEDANTAQFGKLTMAIEELQAAIRTHGYDRPLTDL